MSHFVTTVF